MKMLLAEDESVVTNSAAEAVEVEEKETVVSIARLHPYTTKTTAHNPTHVNARLPECARHQLILTCPYLRVWEIRRLITRLLGAQDTYQDRVGF